MIKTLKLHNALDVTEQVKTAMKEWIICDYYPGFKPRSSLDNERVNQFEEYIASKLQENCKIIAHTIEIDIDPDEEEDRILSIYLGFEHDDNRNPNLKVVEYHDILFTYLNWKDEKGNWFCLRRSSPGSFPLNLEALWHKTEKFYKN